jgi:hypothetical protein
MQLAAAAALYFTAVYAAGFLLGSIRVYWLEPWLGKTFAVLCETPFLLTFIILAARWAPEKFGMAGDRGSLVAIGVGALLLQQVADLTVGIALRGLTPAEQLRNFKTPAGAIYGVLLLLFAIMPLLVNGGKP